MNEKIQLLPNHTISTTATTTYHNKDDDDAQREHVKLNYAMVNLCAIMWTSMILFGAFCLVQYVLPALIQGDWERWEVTDGGLYRSSSKANAIMVAHMICGVCLQALGPIQLIPSIRRKFIRVHRILGRIYIGSALGASGFATIYVLLYGTSRQWIHEDVGNIIFGLCVFGSATASLWYIRKGDVENHKVWSVRLFLAVFGATAFRIISVPYVVAVRLGAPSSQLVINSLFYIIVLPSWLGYELVRRKQLEKITNKASTVIMMAFVVVWAILTLIIFVGAWLPSMLNQPSLQTGAFD